ncbi:MAG: hypothetical protein A3F26_03575 [Candidatus Ryanbacteria bacterium RIFCSPHIGHO2_12_FULL_47_12b]|nr:MAG: hypothetical protein A3F26_03575 [Candidatus Ryanbacteria bacterium RIFCSPHIGHO2_12_FULL_47_12b]
MPISILVTEPDYFTRVSLRAMREVGDVEARRMTRRELLRAVRDIDALVVRIDTRVDAELLRRARRLQCVVSATTGLNHIDVAFLKAHDVPLFSLSGAHSVPTAEHALALLFAIARRIPWAHAHVMRGRWDRWEFIGEEIEGKTLGVVGIGRIGAEITRRARALGMRVYAHDPYVSSRAVAARGARKAGWKTLLSRSDFISLHLPLTLETKHMIGKKEFAVMKPSVILINTARGAIIEEHAFLNALKNKRIYAAALDVYPEEPLAPSSAFRHYARNHTNLILTPHIAASTAEAVDRASMFAADVIKRFFSSRR